MAKQALLDVLEQTIGKYVKDLDAENLNLGIWNGQVELNSLELNVDAVNAELERQAEEAPNLSLPFRVNRGSFGSFQIDVPWSRLMSQPVVLRAHGLNVSVEVFERHFDCSPILRDDNDLKRQKKILEARIKSILAANDTRLRKKAMEELANLDLESSKNTSGEGTTFSSRLVRRIIENIQVEVNDVHISLENGEGTAGIVMESLTLFTTDARGKRSFVDRTSGDHKLSNSFLHKALQIRGLGIYLDEDKDIFHSMQSIDEVGAGRSTFTGPVHSYILAPLSFEATLRQADSNACIDYPKYLLTSKLPSLSVILSKSQLEFSAQVAEQINPSGQSIKPLFPEYRPLRRVTKATAPEWWRYAYRCVGRLSGRRGWKEFFLAFKRRKLYIQLYKRDAHSTDCHWLEPLTAKELRQLHDSENDRAVSIEGIMAWRNIADAQFDKEQDKFDATIAERKAKQKKSRSFFFGTTETEPENPADLPPITLSAEEMKELESINLNQIQTDELSKDSKFCNIHFVLGSFKINLTSYDLRPVAALNMGRVSSAFKANADGSFVFGLKVSSFDVMDMVTPQSLYPKVLGSLRKETTGESDDIFALNIAKSKDGDQTLSAKLVSFQAVASPTLLKAVKKFFTLGARKRVKSVRNPMLAKSLSGSVDLFYDANDGGMETPPPIASPKGAAEEEEAAQTTSSTFSNALIEAWKSKTETKVSWVVDLDIRAPILVLPENCVDEAANVMILDLGHLKFQYGSIQEAEKIQTWFKNHPKSSAEIEPIVDNGKLGITNLQFMVTETASWHRSVAKQGSPDAPFESEAVVEPISINFDFAIETVAATEIPRGCAIGVVPSIVFRFSPAQASRILNVYGAWTRLIKENTDSLDGPETSWGSQLKESEPLSKSEEAEKQSALVLPEHAKGEAAFSVFHVSLWLQRLSVVADFEDEGGADAHLVSVNATLSSMSDGSSITNLSMGWFWILDRFQRQYARKQRLVVHSHLPLEPHLFAIDEKYAILDELKKQGVFEERNSEAPELANITYKSFAPTSDEEDEALPPNQYTSADPFRGAESARVDAKFSSLYIHWNPQAVKTMTSMLGKFKKFLQTSKHVEEDPLLIVSAGSAAPKKPKRMFSNEKPSRSSKTGKKLRGQLFVINAEMKGFDIFLNSARDDLPLYVLNMSRAKVEMLSSAEGDLLVSLALGDLSLGTPNLGETQSDYRTLLGLAPARTESLLCVKYFSGPKAMQGAILSAEGNLEKCEAFCDVELSPMRMVYIHSQVMALVEYATEGILGAIFAQAASSAVAVAADIANAKASETVKQYHIRATAFDFVLPQSARNRKHLSLYAGGLKVIYTSSQSGSEAVVALSDVSLKDSTGERMQEEPIRVDVNVKLPPIGVGTVEEQTMRADLAISSAAFLVSKAQYGQIMLTVDYNIGDYELYLRDNDVGNSEEEKTTEDDQSDVVQLAPLTHAGVAEVIIPRRMVVQVKISVLSIELFSEEMRPLIRAAAVNANIVYNSLFDQEKKVTDVTLGNLTCDDQRPRAVKRQYQSLIYQVERDVQIEKPSNSSVQDVFQIKYESMDNGDTSYDLTIGSPRIVIVPDIVSEVMDFITVEGRAVKIETPSLAPTATDNTDDTDCHVDNDHLTVGVNDGEGGVEVCLQRSVHAAQVSKMSLNIATSRCSLVLVDLGGDLSSIGSPHSKAQGNQVIENLVMEGRANASLSIASNKQSGETMNMDLNAHGDAVEIYTAFGRDMRSPLQILEPAEFSVAMTTSPERFELRAAALTPFNVCFSMRNYALISALLKGMGYGNEKPGESEELSALDAARIEKLARKLDGRADESTLSMSTAQSLRVSESFFRADSDSGVKNNLQYAVSVKLTLPEANLTVINDLLGFDDALFRVTVATFVAGGELRKWLSPTPGAPPLTTFDCHVNTSFMADYFDSSVNLWKKLLTKAWELSLRGARGASKRFQSERLSTTFDIESFPCCLAFSEQFLVSTAAASRMWSIYSVATSSTASLLKQVNVGDAHDSVAERGAASSAARNLITSLPYALENHFGLAIDFKLPGTRADRRQCPSGTIQYFRYQPPAKLGYGGERLYGQDVLYKKSLQLFIGDAVVVIDDLDGDVGKPRRAHVVGGIVLFTSIEKEGKTKVLHLSSSVNIVNATSIPFNISLLTPEKWEDVGICNSSLSAKSSTSFSPGGTSSVRDGVLSKTSKNFGIPVSKLDDFLKSWRKNGRVDTIMKVTPQFSLWAHGDRGQVHGQVDLHGIREFMVQEESKSITTKFDVFCRADEKAAQERRLDAFVFLAHAQLSLVDDEHLFVDLSFEPRAVIVNNLPIAVSLRTPMPHTTSELCQHDNQESIHEVAPGSKVEVFTPGPSIALNVKCADLPIAGTPMGWMETWIDLPLSAEFGMADPLRCVFPFERKNKSSMNWGGGGCEFFVADATTDFSSFFHDIADGELQKRASTAQSYGLELQAALAEPDGHRTFFVTVCNYAVDHTGTVLLEQFYGDEAQGEIVERSPVPYSTFASHLHRSRITLLPRSTIPVRLLHLTMEGEKGIRATVPFKIDNVAICEGGISSTMIPWDDNTPSGYFAYRRLVTSDQSELHIIPEYIVYNGSDENSVLVRQPGYADIVVPPGQIKSVWIQDREAGLLISLEYSEIGGFTPPLRVDSLGLRVAVLKSFESHPLGSIAIQTVIGAKDSRFVVKLGGIKRGSLDSSGSSSAIIDLKRDFLRFRIQASELEVTLNEYRQDDRPVIKGKLGSPQKRGMVKDHETAVCTFLLQRFTVDWQRVFKDEDAKNAKNLRRSVLLSPERSQLSVVIYSILIKDERPETAYPVVFNSTSRASFIDLCVRIRGPLDSDLIKVDLFDLNLAHADNHGTQKMYLHTSEDFVWKLLDVADRISGATAELASEGMKLKWDAEHGGYVVVFDEIEAADETADYAPPRTGSIYDINKARVSPFLMNVSFKRNPQATRYSNQNVQGGAIVKYFTQRLKFQIKDAELSFGVYETNNLKGPSDRLVEVLQAVYLSRIKLKLVSIMTAASFQDWRTLANRTEGGDNFMEGDLVRVAGNLAGKTANMVFKNVGKGMGNGVIKMTSHVGNTFEHASSRVGARAVGAGVNSIISGVGGGVNDGLTGVGTGAGKVFRGVGVGAGQMVGGVTGGMLMAGRGIGQGITQGDGRALVSGVASGVNSVGVGLGQGVGTAVTGAADGVLSVGKGLFSGFRTVGKGIGGAFTGKKDDSKNRRNSGKR